ncbi:hypothetical protein BC826DRAFT_458762 [Russula brevipes]|nr:hypothetical protein BC826DRAFT_458762 [Russula brevipes]
MVRPGQPSTIENALGIHPPSLRPTQGIYSSMAPPDPSTSRAGGASSSRPPTRVGFSPPIATAASVPGYPYSAAPHTNGVGSFYSRGPDPTSRPSSTPIGPVLSPWVAPDLENPSLNSLGLSAQALDGGSTHPQTVRAASASIPQTTRDSVSSWGTADSTPAQGDVFSTLRPLGSAPADGDLPHTDLYPRSDGQLLGVVRAQQFRPPHYPASLVRQGRTVPIATPQPQLPQASTPQPFGGPSNRDSDSRSYSRHAHHPRSQSQTSLLANRDPSQQLPMPPRFTPDDRGFPYASVPPPPPSVAFPTAYPHSAPPRPTTPGSRRSSYSIPIPPFPSIPPPPPVNTASRPPSNAPQTHFSSASSSHSQNPSHRPYY